MTKSKILIGLGLLSTFVVGGLGGSLLFPNTVIVEKQTEVIRTVNQTVEVPVDVIKLVNQTVEVPVEVIKEVNITKEVLVDNGNLSTVLQYIYDNDKSVELLIDDLDDDELDKIVDRITLINEFKKLAIDEVKRDFFDEADRMIVNGIEMDEHDMEKLRLDSDFDEISVSEIDFDDGDAILTLTGSFDQDDIDYEFSVDVLFEDGEFDKLDDISISEE